MAIPPEIRQQILQMRRDDPHLTAHMSDEEIVVLLQQTELTFRIADQNPANGDGQLTRVIPHGDVRDDVNAACPFAVSNG